MDRNEDRKEAPEIIDDAALDDVAGGNFAGLNINPVKAKPGPKPLYGDVVDGTGI